MEAAHLAMLCSEGAAGLGKEMMLSALCLYAGANTASTRQLLLIEAGEHWFQVLVHVRLLCC